MAAGESEGLVPTEGVDEGSSRSTAEGPGSGASGASATPASRGPAPGATAGPAGETDPAGPLSVDTDEARTARQESGSGQQLAEGEG